MECNRIVTEMPSNDGSENFG